MLMRNNVYLGNAENMTVKVNGQPLDLHLEIKQLNPDGFQWGNDSPGAAQLALAILCHEFGDDLSKHPVHYNDLKQIIISHYNPNEFFEITTEQIINWIKKQKN